MVQCNSYRLGVKHLSWIDLTTAEDQPHGSRDSCPTLTRQSYNAHKPQTLTVSSLLCQPACHKPVLALFGYGPIKSQAACASLALACVFIKYYDSP